MEIDEEKTSTEERRKQARENSRVSEIVNFSTQLGAKPETQDDNELFVAQEQPVAKRPRRTPLLTNKEIRQSIHVGRPETGWNTASSKSNSFAGLVTSKQSSSRSKGKAKSKANEVDLDSLFGSDIIKDGQSNAQSASVPTFTKGDKNKALSELIASIPTASQEEAKPDKQAVLDATKKFNLRVKSDKKGGWKHRDLKTSLYHHQILGAAFMRDRENSATRPYGGMLCDVMGLGKTIQTLANIVDGESVDLEDDAKTTLIVVPRSVMDHWKGQIQKHVEPGVLKILYYYPGHRPDSSDIISTILSHNVVITTYEEIRRSYPKSPTSDDEHDPQPLTEEEYKYSAGPLHQIRFRRIIIDEGHLIRNPESQGSVSIRALHAHFKWVLTGTPLLNHTGEFWAYFNFLDIPYIGRYSNFIHNYCSGKEVARKRLVNVVRAVIFRRTHASRLFTFPIIVLPDLEANTLPVEALAAESMIYEMIQDLYIGCINAMAPTGDQQQQFRCFLVMLLKLRMCNSHPLIVQDILKILLEEDENVAKLISIVPEDAEPTDPDRIIVGLLQGLMGTGENTNSSQRSPPGALSTEFRESGEIINSGQTSLVGPLNIDFQKFLQRLRNTDNEEEFHARMKCVCCEDHLTHPEITPCMHLICKECLVTYKEAIKVAGSSSVMCPGACNVEIHNEEPLKLNPSLLTYMQGITKRSRAKKQRPGKRGGRVGPSVLNPGNSMDEINAKESDWVKVAGKEMPSSKVTATRETIQKWLSEDPKNKIVIFTQFCDMVFIFMEMCKEEDWECVKLTGDMSFPNRQGSISDFGNNAEIKVMIASLKAGGVGIDLTMANKCILVEPWWNDATQQQAFCRLFRIGQERNVEIVKIVVQGTIDDYMMQLQEEKNKNIEEAIGDKALTGRSTTLELMTMFGEVAEVPEGGIVIRRRH